MATIYKPPMEFPEKAKFSVFLAGSIEMGTAEKWQEGIEAALADQDITIFNPRRDDWDSSQEQSKDNPYFREQVEWELDALEQADFIIMYLDPNTKSPISLLELGLFARFRGRMLVCCPEGFWRKGNVDIIVERFWLHSAETLDELIEIAPKRVRHHILNF